MSETVESQSYSEPLVGTIAIVLAIISIAIAFGPWSGPYQLPSVAAVRRRFGTRAARLVWFMVALASFTSGLAILTGVRPSYANPGNSPADPSDQTEIRE